MHIRLQNYMNILDRQYGNEAVETAQTEDLLGLIPTALFTLEERYYMQHAH